MSRVIIILFVFFLFVGVSVTFGQEICTPVRLAETTQYNDLGGPFYDFWINGTKYEKHDTATLPAMNHSHLSVGGDTLLLLQSTFCGCTLGP